MSGYCVICQGLVADLEHHMAAHLDNVDYDRCPRCFMKVHVKQMEIHVRTHDSIEKRYGI